MTTRQSIGPKLRFEVFKRDSFTCQYCGSKAPEAVLQVDHIHPVAEGGDADIMNLVTSCRACNGGKGARLLSDASVVEKQRAQIEELEERRQQLEMMLQWRDGLRDLGRAEQDAVARVFDTAQFPYTLGFADHTKVRQWVKKYGVNEVLSAAEEAIAQHGGYHGFRKLGAFLTVRSAAKNKDNLPQFLYIQGILRKRTDDRWLKCVEALEAMHEAGMSIEDLRSYARDADSWEQFAHTIDGEISYEDFRRKRQAGEA